MMSKTLVQRVFVSILIAWLIIGLTACSARKLMVAQVVQMVHSGLPAFEQDDDLPLLAQAFPAHIKLLETFLANDPRNKQLLVLLARMYGGYAFAILETEFEARQYDQPTVVPMQGDADFLEMRMGRYFQKGAAYALRALELRHPDARQKLQSVQSAGAFFQSLSQSDVPALFWYGFNLGGYVQHTLGSVKAMAKAHLAEKAMRRVIALDPTYYHGSAHLVLLVYYASRSPMLGGNPRLAESYYHQHQKLVPAQRRLREMYWARYYLVRKQERRDFLQQLQAVAKEPAAGQPFGLLDRVALERAKVYIGAVDHFFD